MSRCIILYVYCNQCSFVLFYEALFVLFLLYNTLINVRMWFWLWRRFVLRNCLGENTEVDSICDAVDVGSYYTAHCEGFIIEIIFLKRWIQWLLNLGCSLHLTVHMYLDINGLLYFLDKLIYHKENYRKLKFTSLYVNLIIFSRSTLYEFDIYKWRKNYHCCRI